MFRSTAESARWIAASVLGLLPGLAVVGLGIFLALNAARALGDVPFDELAATSWLPLDSRYGMLPLLLGTLASTALALVVAVPLGLCAALYVTLHAGPRLRVGADAAVALLGSMPSVVIGLWGLTWIVPRFGNSLLSASLVLALMIAPTFTLLAGAALRQVPPELAEAVRALGVSDNVTAGVVLRHARWGVIAAATLAATRGLGEAVAVSMVAGNVGAMPALFGPIATLSTTLIVELDGATGVHRSALYLSALVVMLVVSAVSLAGRAMQERHR